MRWCLVLLVASCSFSGPGAQSDDGGGGDGGGGGGDGGGGDGTGDAGVDAILIDAPPGAPSVPREVSAMPGDETITVAWQAPSNPGSSAITGYRVSAIADDTALPPASCTVVDLACDLTGLANGATYSIVVIASNAAGDSPRSAPALAMPRPDELDGELALWLEAGDLQPGAVATWTSRAGDDRTASQAQAGEQPTRGMVANRPAVTFDGADDALVTTSFLQSNGHYTFVSVSANHEQLPIAQSVSPVYGNKQCGRNNDGFAMYSYNSYYGNPATLRPSAEGGNLQSNDVRVNGGDTKVIANNTDADTGVVVESNAWMIVGHRVQLRGSFGQSTLALGSYNPTSCHKGAISIGELIVFPRELTDDAIKSIERYLAQKWRVSLP